MLELKYIISPAVFDDWQALYNLLERGFAPMETRIDPPSSFNNLTPELLREKAEIETLLIAMHDESLVACAFLKQMPEATYVGKVAVDENYQKRGIARSIMEQAADFARSRDKKWLELQTRIELIENHKTFASLGFVKTSESAHQGYDYPTSITMRKRVGR